MHMNARAESALLLIAAVFPALATDPAAPAASAKKPDVAADINQPRADARRIAFDVTEGTWMSVDVAPDGKTIVFDLLGDIYSLPIGGGVAKLVSGGPAFDTHPRYSPDGRTIAFSSDRGGIDNVWLMDADGRNPRPVSAEKDAYVRSAA